MKMTADHNHIDLLGHIYIGCTVSVVDEGMNHSMTLLDDEPVASVVKPTGTRQFYPVSDRKGFFYLAYVTQFDRYPNDICLMLATDLKSENGFTDEMITELEVKYNRLLNFRNRK